MRDDPYRQPAMREWTIDDWHALAALLALDGFRIQHCAHCDRYPDGDPDKHPSCLIVEASAAPGTASPPPEAERVWCNDCTDYSARVVRVDEHNDEIITCDGCKRTWVHP